MSLLITSMVIILTVSILAYTIVGIIYSTSNVLQDLASSTIQLNKANTVLDSASVKSTLFSQGGSTVAGFFNVTMGDRTTRVGPTNFTTLIGVNGGFEVQIAPSSLSPEHATNTARLIVYTEGGSTKKMEVVELPPFPQQKWVFLSILRDGRRFDVMYDDKIVASHRLTLYPVPINNPLVAGSPQLLGQAVHIFVAGSRISPTVLSQQRAKYVDTTGAIPSTYPIPFLPIPFGDIQTVCIPGLTCDAVTRPPTNPLKAWRSLYA